MKRKRQRWTRGPSFHEAPDVRVAEVAKVDESLGVHFLTLRAADASEWLYISDAGTFAIGDRVRITVEGPFVREVVAA